MRPRSPLPPALLGRPFTVALCSTRVCPTPTPSAAPCPAADHPVAWPDIAWARWRVAVEVDGLSHLQGPQRQRDVERARALADIGWQVVVITSRDAHQAMPLATGRVAAALRGQGARCERVAGSGVLGWRRSMITVRG